MRATPPLLVLLLLSATVLAGCNDPEPKVHQDPDKGVLRGVVVDEAVRPLEGATVRAARADAPDAPLVLTTGPDGAFTAPDLVPGLYVVTVSKVGYTPSQGTTDVVAGVAEPPSARFMLIADPTSVPFAQVHHFTGFLECSARASVPGFGSLGLGPCAGVTILGTSTGPIGNDHGQVSIPFEGMPTHVQAEMEWTSTQSTGTGLSLVAGPPLEEGETFCRDIKWARADGASPLVAGVNETVLAENAEDGAAEGICLRVFAWTAGETADTVGVALSQEFDIVVTVFYNFTPDDGWTYAASGEPVPPA